MLADAPGSAQVVCGSDSGFAILREESVTFQDELRTKVGGISRSIIYNPATFPALVKNAALTVNAIPYRAGLPQLQKNGTRMVDLVEP